MSEETKGLEERGEDSGEREGGGQREGLPFMLYCLDVEAKRWRDGIDIFSYELL